MDAQGVEPWSKEISVETSFTCVAEEFGCRVWHWRFQHASQNHVCLKVSHQVGAAPPSSSHCVWPASPTVTPEFGGTPRPRKRWRNRCCWQLSFPGPFVTRRLRPRDTQSSSSFSLSKPEHARMKKDLTPKRNSKSIFPNPNFTILVEAAFCKKVVTEMLPQV